MNLSLRVTTLVASLLLLASACTSPRTVVDQPIVPPPSILVNAPFDQVLTAVTTEPYAADLLAKNPKLLVKGNNEAWINKGFLDMPNLHFRIHLVASDASQTTVSLGVYNDDGSSNTHTGQAETFTTKALQPLKAYFDQGQSGPKPSLVFLKG